MADPRAPILLENEPGQEFYEVEAILGRRRNERRKTYEYLIKWEQWPHADNSWEAEHRLKYCKDLKADFDRAHPLKRMAPMPTTVAKKPKAFTHPVTKPSMKSPSKVSAKSPAAEAVAPMQVPAYQSLVSTAVACKKEHAQLHSAKNITVSKTPTDKDVSELKVSTAAIATPQSEPSTVSSSAVTSVEPQHKPARHSPAMTVDLSKQQPLEQGIGMASMTAHKVHVHLESSAKGIDSQDDAATDSCAKANPFQAESALSTHVTIPSTRVPPAKPPAADQQPSPSQLVDSSDFLPQLSSDSSSSSGSSETSSSTSSESSSSSDSSSSDEL